jgi:choline dehydrogenase
MDEFDYIIVGGGAAGCVLANRLSADPSCRVAMIEPGRDRNSKKGIVRIPLGMISFMMPAVAFLGGPKFMSWYETEPEPGLQGRRIALPRGRATGGSTTVNGMIYIRGQREDFDHWRELGNEGWGYDDLLPYFKRTETFEILNDPDVTRGLDLGGRPVSEQIDPAFHGTDGPVNVAPLRSVNPMCNVFLEAAKQAGYSYNADFNGAGQSGFGYYWFTQKGGERMSAERAYLDPVRGRANLTILSGRRVTRVLLEGDRAVGVETDGGDGKRDIRAGREVILSAGAFMSPQILMLSGIGDPAELSRHGIDVRHDLKGVGANLQDHIDVTLEYKAKTTVPYGMSWRALPRNILHVFDWIFRKRGLFASTTGEGGAFVSTKPETDRPDIQLFFCTSVGNAQNAGSMFGHGFLLHVCELRPGSVGRLRLVDADPTTPPSIIYNFFRGASSMDALKAGMKIVRNIVGQEAFAPHLDHEVTPGPEAGSDGALEAYIRQTCGTLYHPVGTCAMGHGPDAVVDPATLGVHGISGLRVIDASIMPTIVSGNTMAATYCIAEKGADLVLTDWRDGR